LLQLIEHLMYSIDTDISNYGCH